MNLFTEDTKPETLEDLRKRLKDQAQEEANQRQIDQLLRPEAYAQDPEPERYPVHMLVTELQWTMIEEALDLLKKQSEGYIKRAENNPSETIKSTLTIQRHQDKLRQLDDVISRFHENTF